MAANPQRRPSIGVLLERARDELDTLVAESHSIRSARHYEDLEERAAGIGRQLTHAFRKGRA